MHKPRSALWYLRAQVWNLMEDHPIAFPLDFSWIMYRRTSGSSPFRSFSISASIDTIDFTCPAWSESHDFLIILPLVKRLEILPFWSSENDAFPRQHSRTSPVNA